MLKLPQRGARVLHESGKNVPQQVSQRYYRVRTSIDVSDFKQAILFQRTRELGKIAVKTGVAACYDLMEDAVTITALIYFAFLPRPHIKIRVDDLLSKMNCSAGFKSDADHQHVSIVVA